MTVLFRHLSLLTLLAMLTSLSQAAAPPTDRDAYGDSLPRGASARLGSLRFRMGPGELPAAFMPDGKHIVLRGDLLASLAVLDTTTSKTRRIELPRMEGEALGQQTLAVSPTGDRALVPVGGDSLAMYDLNSGKQLWSIKASTQKFPTFDPTGKHFAWVKVTEQGDGNIHIHNSAFGRQIATIPFKAQDHRFALSPEADRILIWDSQPKENPNPQLVGWEVVFHDVAKNKEIAKLTLKNGNPEAVFRPDGKEVALIAGGTITTYNPSTAVKTRTFRASTHVSLVSYSPDGNYLAAAGSGRVDLWETKAWKRLPTRALPACAMTALGFPAPGKLLVAGVQNRELILIDALSGKVTRSPSGHTGSVSSLFFEGNTLLTAGTDGKVTTWDFAGRQKTQVTVMNLDQFDPLSARIDGPGFGGRVLAQLAPGGGGGIIGGGGVRMEFSASGRYVVGGDGSGFIYDRKAEEMRFDNVSDVGGADTARIARDTDVLITAGGDDENPNGGSLKVTAMRVENGEQLWTEQVGGMGAMRIAVSPDGKVVAICGSSGEGKMGVHLLDGKTGKAIPDARVYEQAGNACTMLEFSGDGQLLFGAAENGGIFVLDARSGQSAHSIHVEGHISVATLCPRRRMLAYAAAKDETSNTAIHLCELASGKTRLIFAPDDVVTSLCFSPDDKYLASGHDNGTALLWELEPHTQGDKGSWARLTSTDAEDAYRAIWELREQGASAVKLVREHVKPAPSGPADDEVKKLIAQLDDEESKPRDAAQRQLRSHGRSVESALRMALEAKPSLEASRRLKRLLEALPQVYEVSAIAPLRGVELLELINSPESRQALAELAKGNINSIVTQEAKAALARMK